MPEVLDHSVRRFSGTNELESERIAICECLVRLDPSNAEAYVAETEKLRQSRALRESIQYVDESKVFVDVDGIERSLEPSYRDKFDRYVKISAISDKKLREALILQGYDVSNFEKIVNFEDYGFLLFKELFTHLRDRFVSSNEHGLDSYLSLRIRHGTLLGHLRSPFEMWHLVTARDKDRKYARNDYWLETIHLPDQQRAALGDCFRDLSASLDELNERVRSRWIQLKGPPNENMGLFDFGYSDQQWKLMYARYATITKFDDFFQACVQELWQRAEENLAVVKHAITRTLRDEMIGLLDQFRERIAKLCLGADASPLMSAVTQCRTKIQEELERLASWFTVLDRKLLENFNFRHLLHTCEAILKRCFPLRLLRTTVVDSGGLRAIAGSTFTHFVDAFYIILENVIKHSGIDAPEVRVFGNLVGGILTFRIENDLAEGLDLYLTKQKIEALDAGNIAADNRARTEGGTGYYKLAKILRHDLRRARCDGRLSVTELRTFEVLVTMEPDGILL